MQKTIDYSPLVSRPSELKSRNSKASFIWSLFVVGCALYLLSFVFILMFAILTGSAAFVGAVFVFLPIAVVGFIIGVIQGRLPSSSNNYVLFAAKNAWEYGAASEQFKSSAYKQSLNRLYPTVTEDSEVVTIRGNYKTIPFELGLGVVARGSKTDPEIIELRMLFKVRATLPEAVVISRDMTQATETFDKMLIPFENPQQVDLEGNFNKSLQLYVPQNSQVDVLAVISPDVMQTMQAYAPKFTIVLYGQHVVLSPLMSSQGRETVQLLFEATERLYKEFA